MSVGDYCDDPEVEAFFAEDDEWIAALARQVFRARRDEDARAAEVTFFYLEDFLAKTLKRHLRYRDPLWADDSVYRWFDGMSVDAEFPSPDRLELRGQIAWVTGQTNWYYDPFAFDLKLCPESGAFRGYAFRFGDHSSLCVKGSRNPNELLSSPVGGWQYEIHRGSLTE